MEKFKLSNPLRRSELTTLEKLFKIFPQRKYHVQFIGEFYKTLKEQVIFIYTNSSKKH